MTFLNAMLLWGSLAIGVPILLELLNRTRVRHMKWAAMRFLEVCVQENRRRLRLEDLLLMLVRCLVLLLLALALARPLFSRSSTAKGLNHAVTAIILIDVSYGMQMSDGSGRTRLDQARETAETIVDSLPRGSAAALYLFAERAMPLIPIPTGDLALIRRTLRDFSASDPASGPLAVPLQQVIDRLSSEGDVQGEVYVVTDGQSHVFRGMVPLSELAASVRESFPLSLLVLNAPIEANLGVSRLEPDTALPAADEPARFFVEVTNYGQTSYENINVGLSLNGEPASAGGRIPALSPGESVMTAIEIRLPEEGTHHVTAFIPDDRLAVDNRRTLAIRTHDRVNLLLVEGRTETEPSENSLFFLRQALQPVPPAQRGDFLLQVHTVSGADFRAPDLTGVSVAVLSELPNLTPETVDALEAFVAGGGSLLIFPGPDTDIEFHNQVLYRETGLAPAGLIPPDPALEERRVIQDRNPDHAATSAFSGGVSGSLSSVLFTRTALLNREDETESSFPPRAGPVTLVAEFTDGDPAVLERPFGRGRVILFSSTADTTWNDFPLRAVYVPFIHRLVGYLLQLQDTQLNLSVGQSMTVELSPEALDRVATIEQLAEDDEPYREVTHVELVGERVLMRTPPLPRAGGYLLRVEGLDDIVHRVAVQTDPEESSQEILDPEDYDRLDSSIRVIRDTESDPMTARVNSLRRGSELSRAFLTFLLVLLVLESILAHRFSRSR
ncbi:MAG: BatA domain-containing protein [Kiritimatiellia bacterium]